MNPITIRFPSRSFRSLLTFFSLQILFLPFLNRTWAAESHQYAEKTGSQTSSFHWKLDIDNRTNTAVITARDVDVTYVNICETTGATNAWRMTRKDCEVKVRREKNELYMAGTKEGKKIDKIITLDDAPWYQPLSYSLRNMVQEGNNGQTTFWMLRPDTLEAHKFQATRSGREEIFLGSAAFQAVRITICPSGMFACLWHATYWFRSCDGLFLRYEGTHGLPGTPETIINHDPPPEACK